MPIAMVILRCLVFMPYQLPLGEKELISTIISHGWYKLEPFKTDLSVPNFSVTFDLPIGSGSFYIETSEGATQLIKIEGETTDCKNVAESCLSLNFNTTAFYEKLSGNGLDLGWVRANKMGRFLRSPSLFEDCCKAILSTNTNWQRTVKMVSDLVERYGRKVGEAKAFPRPEAVLEATEIELKESSGCGFRAKYILGLASIAIKEKMFFLDQTWAEVPPKEFNETLLKIKGVGPVSANYLSMIYGKPWGFNIDAYVERRCKELWGICGQGLEDFLLKRYSKFKGIAPIVLWFEITRHWQSIYPDLPTGKW